jgi:hypothetical protein
VHRAKRADVDRAVTEMWVRDVRRVARSGDWLLRTIPRRYPIRAPHRDRPMFFSDSRQTDQAPGPTSARPVRSSLRWAHDPPTVPDLLTDLITRAVVPSTAGKKRQ